MRVLQVHTRYRQPGGEDSVVEAEAALLAAAGHEVHQFLAENPPGAGAAVALAGAVWNPAAAARLRRRATTLAPDIVHVHNTWFAMSPAVAMAASRLGRPVVMTVHNYRLVCANALLFREGAPCRLCVEGSAFNGAIHRCYRGLAPSLVAAAGVGLHRSLGTWRRAVDLFLALTGFARDLLVQGGIPAERILVKPNFVPDPGPRPSAPSRSGTLLFAGRLSEEKGIRLLLDAWRSHRPAGLELAVAGDGPLEQLVTGDGVTRLGRLSRDDLRRRMTTSRALVVPSVWYEGMPIVVLEALAAGLPVMAGDLGGLADIVGELGREWLVAPHLDSWVAGLERLGSDEAVDHASLTARALYLAKYDPVTALDRLESAYEQAIALAG